MSEQFTFFWKTESPFSQWHPSEFTINEIKYCCAEQYMMACKAKLFNDLDALNKIMATDDPRKQKKLGRQVNNFNAEMWEQNCKSVVYDGNKAKFTQNPKLLEALLATGDTTLVEASPYDKTWGIGLSENDPLAHSRDTWQGTNWLGEILTKLRNDLRQ